jgi:hypothetical protein
MMAEGIDHAFQVTRNLRTIAPDEKEAAPEPDIDKGYYGGKSIQEYSDRSTILQSQPHRLFHGRWHGFRPDACNHR